jgi:hypothetical protein
MKNVHLLPTGKKFAGISAENIYITSDEEIKKGDWCLDKFNQRWKLEDKKLIAFDSKGIKRFSTDNILGHECKKIILTTDADIIKDGVQAIDDKFLEWFVKNPSCEWVEVECMVNMIQFTSREFIYKIIIPKEEPKQETTLEEVAEKIYNEFPLRSESLNNLAKEKFIAGAKWQQERSYSEEEVLEIIKKLHTEIGIQFSNEIKEWCLKQLEKK